MTGITSGALPSTAADPSKLRAPPAPLRVALVGAGKMGAHHARAIGVVPGSRARLVAVADPSAAARQAVVAAVPGVAEFDSLTAALSGVAVDVVHVCTPPATHVSMARAALDAGCHVYVEKPFSETLADADEILRAAERLGRKVCAGHQLLFEQPARVAAQLTPALGRLVHVESYFSFRTVRRAPGGRAPLRADLQLLDILPHPVYLLLNFLQSAGGAPATLSALELGNAGTVHALVRRGAVTGHLIVTLEGRPIESYLRLVGTNGSVHADFVRGTVQRLFGPGTSGIDKLLAPYRVAAQMLTGTTAALSRRVLKRQRSYPGLAELFDAFYQSIQHGTPSPVSSESIRETVRLCEAVARRLAPEEQPPVGQRARSGPRIVLTGGTGFLGRATAAALAARGATVRVLARRQPAAWERVPDVEYAVADLGEGVRGSLLADADVVVHAAAETAGGWDEHQRNSVNATENLVLSAADAGVRRFLHVSSLAVLAKPVRGGDIDEGTTLETNSRGSGPYVWGKLESEQRAVALGREHGIDVKIVRPGAIIDYAAFEPPGRLGKRIGPFFVAVGSPSDRLGVVDLAFATDVIEWAAVHFEQAPAALNLLSPELPTKRELLRRLRCTDPDLKVIWLPWAVLIPLSGIASALQKLLRPARPRISLQRVFATPRYNTSVIRDVAARILASRESRHEIL